ncbi:MAG: hypothetical protein J6P37_02750 [Lachnospiraceae bacterium]|nr:hypothetical protein [Lachnospiraceae bacterium]
MFENYPNYDSINADREREEKLMQDKRERCHKRGKLYFVLFWLTVLGTPVIFLLALIGGIVSGVVDALYDSMSVYYLVIGGISLISLATGIVTAVMLFILGQDESCFKAAGIAFILVNIFNVIAEFVPEGFISTILKLLTLVAELFYLFEFINGSIFILAGVDDYLASSWETIKKVFIYLFIGLAACIVLAFIPFINILALIVLVIAAIGSIGVLIWEWVLMFKTARALKNF